MLFSSGLLFISLVRDDCGSLIILTIFDSGLDMRPTILALNSSKLGKLANVLISSTLNSLLPIAPPIILRFSLFLAKSKTAFAHEAGSSE